MVSAMSENWYDAVYDAADLSSNPFSSFSVGERRGNGELTEYLRLGGRLSERGGDDAAERERVSNMLNRAIAKSISKQRHDTRRAQSVLSQWWNEVRHFDGARKRSRGQGLDGSTPSSAASLDNRCAP